MTEMQYSQVSPDHQFDLEIHLVLKPQELQGFPKMRYWEDKRFMTKSHKDLKSDFIMLYTSGPGGPCLPWGPSLPGRP